MRFSTLPLGSAGSALVLGGVGTLLLLGGSPTQAITHQSTAKKVPGLHSLLAFKAAEAAQLGFELDEPRALLDNILTLQGEENDDEEEEEEEDESAAAKVGPYGPHTFTQPLDHFHNTTAATFKQRYWISTKHYNPKSKTPTPVYVVDGGETSGANRIPFLTDGILDILAEATGGISIVLEHRYYGASKPKLSDIGNKTYWDVDALRWLTNEQALEDSARFMRHVKLPGASLPSDTLTADKTPWIYIGGSYAGARAAHMRVLYPDLVFGAISTSGVSAAIDFFPQYYYPIARGADPACTQAIQAAIAAFDAIAVPAHHRQTSNRTATILAKAGKKEAALRQLFRTHDLDWDDFANVLTGQLGYFQALNWDPAVSSGGWASFCDVMTNKTAIKAKDVVRPHRLGRLMARKSERNNESWEARARAYREGFARSAVPALRAELEAAGHLHTTTTESENEDEDDPPLTTWLPDELFRLASYVRAHFIEPCARSGASLRQCFSTKGPAAWRDFVHAPRLRMDKAWTWQVCTQWGYHQGAPPRQPSFANDGGRRGGGSGRIHPHRPSSSSSTGFTSSEASTGQRPMALDDDEERAETIPGSDPLTASSLFDERGAATSYTSGPQLVSSLLTFSYTAAFCADAFPSTPDVRLPDRPDIEEVNRLGAFGIGEGLDRLAIVNGQWDPWRPATPHSEEFAGGGGRADTLMRPFKLIPNCWHHCDQNGLPSKDRKAGKEPERIRKIHEEEVIFVRAWLEQWGKKQKKRNM
ncbi:Serine carboxypeptidase S28 [Tilletia horrida]|nr:Serine carboxypeptidase S28 [Tilletia horrida]